MVNRILTPRELLVGGGARHKLAGMLTSMKLRRPLLVCDPAMVATGHATEMSDALAAAGIDCALFHGVVPDPDDASVIALAWQACDGAHDCLVALGGGSAIDTAKAAAVAAFHDGPLSALKVPRIVDISALPVIAIPTTAGTGSEVTRAAVITDSCSAEKMLILGTAVLPVAAIVDYELTLSCPYRVTVDTGIDALTHALEALVNRNANAHSNALALSALRLIGRNLDTAANEPDNRAAREAMMMGALHAGMAVSNTSTALIHGMSRPIGAFFHVPHGMSNAMVLPLVTQFSLSAAPDRYAMAAEALGFEGDMVQAMIAMNARFSVPTPQEFGIRRDEYFGRIKDMAQQGLASGTPGNNPRVPSLPEMENLYALAYDGQPS